MAAKSFACLRQLLPYKEICMRKSLAILLLSIALILNACQKNLQYDVGTGTGGGPGALPPPVSSSADCKACSYFPYCNGNYYTFSDTIAGVPSVATDTMDYVKDTVIANLTFQKVYSPASKGYVFYNCTSGNSRLIGYTLNTLAGNTVSKLDYTVLKADLPKGGTWADSLINPQGQLVIYNNRLMDKGVSLVVNGKTYPDVIHVYTDISINLPGLGNVPSSNSDYYYARGVGLVEAVTFYPGTGNVFMHRALVSYHVQ